jgi:hypothetical protein
MMEWRNNGALVLKELQGLLVQTGVRCFSGYVAITPSFHYSNIPLFHCSIIPSFQYSLDRVAAWPRHKQGNCVVFLQTSHLILIIF